MAVGGPTMTNSNLQLATLLCRHRDQIADRWAQRVRDLAGTRYQGYALAEVCDWAASWVDTAVETLSTGAYQVTEDHLREVSLARLRMGFTMAEVLEALLLLRDAAMAVLGQDPPSGSVEEQSILAAMDAYLRYLVARFGHLYAQAMTRNLQEQQRRTDLILQTVGTVNSSLDLDQVLQWIVEQSAAIFGLGCILCLLDAEQGNLEPRAMAGYSAGQHPTCLDRLQPCPGSDHLLQELLRSGAPITCYDAVQDARFSPEIVGALSLKSAVAVPITADGRILGVLIGTTLDDHREFSSDDVDLLVGLLNAVGLAIRNAQLYEATRRRLADMESLQRVTTALLQELPLEEILGVVCLEAQQLTGATGSTVLLLEEGVWLRITGSTGTPLPASSRLPVEGSFAGRAIQRGEPLLVNEPSGLAQAYHSVPEVESLLVVPLTVGEAIVGALDVVNKAGGFTEDDLRIMGLYADSVAIAIESARLQQQAEELAVMEERQRLARELHDSVTQALYSVTLYAEASRLALAAGKQDVALDNLGELHHMAREAMLDMRVLIFELHPPVLEEEGLVAALQARLAAVESRAGLQTGIRVHGERRLPLAVEEELFWIALEAFNNVIKHARARLLTVDLRYGDAVACLEIADDGLGFDLAAASERGGLGLRGIAERAQRIQAELNIRSSPGQGTILRVEVPVSRVGEDES